MDCDFYFTVDDVFSATSGLRFVALFFVSRAAFLEARTHSRRDLFVERGHWCDRRDDFEPDAEGGESSSIFARTAVLPPAEMESGLTNIDRENKILCHQGGADDLRIRFDFVARNTFSRVKRALRIRTPAPECGGPSR